MWPLAPGRLDARIFNSRQQFRDLRKDVAKHGAILVFPVSVYLVSGPKILKPPPSL